jgi:uncharacterized surface protein with fasciclin (FAS1) repeats
MKHFKTIAILAAVAFGLSGLHIATADCGHPHGKTSEAKASKAIYQTAKSAGFETLTAAIDAAGLEEVLTEGGPFTVFAPTDEAFAKLPEGTVEALLKDKEALKQVLLYHVVSGEVMAKDVVKLKKAVTLNGQMVMIDTKDGVKINDANVIKTDIETENGVIHVIDTVLIPKSDA